MEFCDVILKVENVIFVVYWVVFVGNLFYLKNIFFV